jgi:hypothetical protein
MNLPRALIWVLTVVYGLCFAGFAVTGLSAMARGGSTHEYEVLGLGLPKVLLALLVGMAVSAALPWAHYKRESYTAFEETFYGVLLGVSAFGLIMVVPLVLST